MPPPPPPPLPADPVHIEANIQQTAQRQEINVAMIVLNVVNTVTHVLIGAVALSAFIFANVFHGTNNLKQHIYLCVTGVSNLFNSLNFNTSIRFVIKNKKCNKIDLVTATQYIGQQRRCFSFEFHNFYADVHKKSLQEIFVKIKL